MQRGNCLCLYRYSMPHNSTPPPASWSPRDDRALVGIRLHLDISGPVFARSVPSSPSLNNSWQLGKQPCASATVPIYSIRPTLYSRLSKRAASLVCATIFTFGYRYPSSEPTRPRPPPTRPYSSLWHCVFLSLARRQRVPLLNSHISKLYLVVF